MDGQKLQTVVGPCMKALHESQSELQNRPLDGVSFWNGSTWSKQFLDVGALRPPTIISASDLALSHAMRFDQSPTVARSQELSSFLLQQQH